MFTKRRTIAFLAACAVFVILDLWIFSVIKSSFAKAAMEDRKQLVLAIARSAPGEGTSAGAGEAAAAAWLTAAKKNPKWDKLVAPFTKPVPGSEVKPDKKVVKIYDAMVDKYAGCESEALDPV